MSKVHIIKSIGHMHAIHKRDWILETYHLHIRDTKQLQVIHSIRYITLVKQPDISDKDIKKLLNYIWLASGFEL